MRFLLTASLIGLLAIPATGADAKHLIKARQVHLGTGEVLEPGMVLIENGKIAAVGQSLDAGDATVVEVDSVMPGLVDAYTQTGVSQSAERTDEVTAHLSTRSVINWRAPAFARSLASGTTTVNVAPGTDNVFAGLACAAKTAGKPKQRIIAMDTGLLVSVCNDPARGNRARSRPDSIYTRQPTNRMGVVWILRATFHKADRPNVSDPSLTVVRQALEGQRKLYAVSRTHYDILSLLNISREFGLKSPTIVGGQESWKILGEIQEAGSQVVLGRQLDARRRGPEGTWLSANAAQKLDDAGITFCLSEGQLLEQARFAVRNGLKPESAIKAITSTPAKILGVEKRVGSIAAGLDADLVALSGSPLEFTTAINWVMVDGVIQKQAGN